MLNTEIFTYADDFYIQSWMQTKKNQCFSKSSTNKSFKLVVTLRGSSTKPAETMAASNTCKQKWNTFSMYSKIPTNDDRGEIVN